MPRISLIHAVHVAIEPVVETFQSDWPEAEVYSLLEDSLSRDLQTAGEIDSAMIGRFKRLADYAVDTGADGILFTCSAFGTAIEAATAAHTSLPILKPNEAMFEEAIGMGDRIGMITTFQPSIPSMTREFEEMAAAAGSSARLETAFAPNAMATLSDGDAETHNRLVADAVEQFAETDVLLLAQFSTAQARLAVEAKYAKPVLTSPGSAVRKLRRLLNG